jgi:hypothetical protein
MNLPQAVSRDERSAARVLAAEIGPRGVRVLGIWTAGLPETLTLERLAQVDSKFQDEAAYRA